MGIRRGGYIRVAGDYLILRDYYKGGHTKSLLSILKRFGSSFLSPEELKQFESLAGSPEKERDQWLVATAGSSVQLFWYFVVSLWRHLQEEENLLSPKEAYWLGAVDEVIGMKLLSFRQVAETVPDPVGENGEAIPPATAPEPPS